MSGSCVHYDEGDAFDGSDNGPVCGKPATHHSCCWGLPVRINVCAEHKCRCAQDEPADVAETLSVPPGCRCRFGAEWAGGFDSDGCAAHGPAFAALKAQVATLEGELAATDEWILNHTPLIPRTDHACKECLSGGPIVIPGFQCVPHAAAARTLVRRVRGGT